MRHILIIIWDNFHTNPRVEGTDMDSGLLARDLHYIWPGRICIWRRRRYEHYDFKLLLYVVIRLGEYLSILGPSGVAAVANGWDI
jgi:hypothetical protein